MEKIWSHLLTMEIAKHGLMLLHLDRSGDNFKRSKGFFQQAFKFLMNWRIGLFRPKDEVIINLVLI